MTLSSKSEKALLQVFDDNAARLARAENRVDELEHELAQTRTALLIYGQHLPICGTLTAAGCDCTWAEWQRNLETEGRC